MNEPRRKPTLRLPEYDYATTGSYFVTITVWNQACLFGRIDQGALDLSVPGLMVESWWGNIERRFPTTMLGPYVVMPNHLHGVIHLGAIAEPNAINNEEGDHAGSPVRRSAAPQDFVRAARRGRPTYEDGASIEGPPSLSTVVGWFKTMTTNDYIRGVREFGFPPFDRRLWHRTYYDHIVRNSTDLARIERYIEDNPARWAMDEFFRD